VQLVIAGKAHPADDSGKQLIQQMVRFADDPRVRHRIVFLPDYDMELAATMVGGCDVWLNNPLRPLEACGTSGMKSALNGGLNLSVRDGWWDEWFDGENGWAIPSADDVADPARRDELESAAMYDLLEQVVAPLFYDTGADGLPQRWLEMVAHTLAGLGPRAQAARMVREYVETLYVPAALASRALAGDHGEGAFAAARELAGWKRRVKAAWPSVRIEHIEAGDGDRGPGEWLPVRASVALGELTPGDVTVEVICGRVNDEEDIVEPEASPLAPDGPGAAEGPAAQPQGAEASGTSPGPPPGANTVRYAGEARLGRPGPFGYTVRVVPCHPLLDSTAELGLVTYPDAPEGMTNGDLR
jgi:starch phosphorylase